MWSSIASPIFDARLRPLGFAEVRNLTWVRARSDQIRDVVQLAPTKTTRGLRWGIDLAFVPKVTSRVLRWKRQVQQVCLDLVIDPVDEIGRPSQRFSYNDFPPAPPTSQLERIADAEIPAIVAELEAISSYASFIDTMEVREQRVWRRFSPRNYVQTDIACGLALHAIGDAARADTRLNRFCEQFRISRTDRLLLRAIDGARAASAVTELR